MLVDASGATAEIDYPTDLGLLNDARKKRGKTFDIWLVRTRCTSQAAHLLKKTRKQYLSVKSIKKDHK